jgi:hypothetical protein
MQDGLDKEDTSWYLAEVTKIFPDEIEVAYYTTPKPLIEGCATATAFISESTTS